MKSISKKVSVFIASLFILSFLAAPVSVYAGDTFNDICTQAPNSTVCKSRNSSGNPIYGPDGVITRAISIMSIIVGIAAVFALIFAGAKFITSGSNPQDTAKAREMVIYAIVGLIIALLAQLIVQFFLKRIS